LTNICCDLLVVAYVFTLLLSVLCYRCRAGNEPDIFAVWLFNWAHRPDLAQKYTRQLLTIRYTPTREIGLPGNDDYGTISAWASWAALGLYPQAGNSTYALGSPVFPQVVVRRGAELGGDLTIRAVNASDTNIYVQSVSLNGVQLASPFVRHEQLKGTLEFSMGAQPAMGAFDY
jgi:putative alpha-1,2-mannosidase